MLYLAIFLMIPVLEIFTFVAVGQEIGAPNTILLTILTAALGVFLLRAQGMETLKNMQSKVNRGEPPTTEIFNGICLFLAGVCLMIPGFVTDSFGALLFIPFVRSFLHGYVQSLPNVFMQTDFSSADMFRREQQARGEKYRQEQRQSLGDTIEGDYVDITQTDQESDKSDK